MDDSRKQSEVCRFPAHKIACPSTSMRASGKSWEVGKSMRLGAELTGKNPKSTSLKGRPGYGS
jgi:hypothetical protein